MAQLTLPVLTEMLRKAAGEAEGDAPDLSGDIIDVTFVDLGYDSLALLELLGMVEREFSIALSDDTIQDAETPRMFMDLVNSATTAAA
ncbi:MAG: acyl carrier protein [Streptomycetaceae bacterium]|jgi:act minimal PKS acyl carrier protein|uniref:acyl carrier protein n=1 Tax=Uniformispora flossi TaxID=3390723 RepID=UPI0017C5F8E2|nr:acyl carrier protein [Streptomycetaceae bacterium]